MTEGLQMRLHRHAAVGGDHSVFGIEFLVPVNCGKHRAAKSAIFKGGPCEEVRMKDEGGYEVIDLEGILQDLAPHAQDCPVCKDAP